MWRRLSWIFVALLTLGLGEGPPPAPQGCRPYPKANYPQDSFGTPLKPGEVGGSSSPEGTPRLVLDKGRARMAVDHCALRMPEARSPRFGQVGLAYPKMKRQNGRVVHFRLLPGDIQQPNGVVVGAFPEAHPADPLKGANAVALDNFDSLAGTFNLGFREGTRPTLLPQFQTPLDVYVLLREQGAVYLVDGLKGGYYAAPPSASVLGLDQTLSFGEFYPGAHSSSTLHAHRLEHFQVRDVAAWSRWYGTAHAADRLTGGGALGTAEKGGAWTVTGNLSSTADGATADAGGALAVLDPGAPSQVLGLTVKTGADPQGVGLIFRAKKNGGGVYTDYYELFISTTGYELVRVSGATRTRINFGNTAGQLLPKNATVHLQVIDSGPKDTRFSAGGRIRFFLDDKELLSIDAPANNFSNDDNNASAGFTGVGFRIAPGSAGGTAVSYFEAHPRTITLPAELLLREEEAPLEDTGNVVVAFDDFSGEFRELAGRKTPVGGLVWEKKASRNPEEYLAVDGNGYVTAFPTSLNGSRGNFLLYGLPWPSQYKNFASLEATIVPPGSGVLRREGEVLGVGQQTCSGFDADNPSRKHRLRAGLLLWQDKNNYVLLRGFIDESQSDASEVEWQVPSRPDYAPVVRRTNLNVRWCHGQPTTLRLSTDGDRITLWVKGAVGVGDPDTKFEPVQTFRWTDLFPDRPPLSINLVGLYFSEDDTGARVDSFKASARR
ncbi:MAG: hypothetical protein C4333_03930 [Meiothermus sp.]